MKDERQIHATRNYCGLKNDVVKLIDQLRAMLYPNIFGTAGAKGVTKEALEMNARKTFVHVIGYFIKDKDKRAGVVDELIAYLPEIHRIINTDVQAAYEGDPAAHSYDEIMLSYPTFEALTIFRVANKLYQMEVPILPRMMSEHAHSITGIDIHPGATIGEYFFIDHGTGVVIGETATIGDRVKIYQGVTIGAKSFKTDKNGKIIKGIKRHPDIGNNVVIYSGATILGGDTTIGDDCVIGGNVWLTRSVEPKQTVFTANNEVSQMESKE